MPRKDSPTLRSYSSQVAGLSGKQYWRSLEELSQTEEFEEYLHREFPDAASEWTAGTDRRHFLSLMGASLALAGLAGCAPRAEEKIVPYVRQPENIVPGKPLWYATAMPVNGYAIGVLAESHMGRPTKIEGNPSHPSSLGGATARMQASILTMYDPDRSQTVDRKRQIQTWDAFLTELGPEVESLKQRKGKGLRLLTGPITSPTLLDQLARMQELYPEMVWHQYDAELGGNEQAGIAAVYGRPLDAIYDFSRADVILSLDSDFACSGPAQVLNAREFANQRRVAPERDDDQVTMSRFYALEATPTATGAKADHRLPISSREIEAVAVALAQRLGVSGVESNSDGQSPIPDEWFDAVVGDLQDYRNSSDGACLVIAGESQSPRVHALVHLINAQLGAVGKSVRYVEPIAPHRSTGFQSLEQLVVDMNAGQVDTLVVLGVNPVYDAPAKLEIGPALKDVRVKIHHGLYSDETSLACDWHLPALHYLESWGDLRAHDGTVTIQQPLIQPLYAGRSEAEVFAALLGEAGRSTKEIVQDYWKTERAADNFEDQWATWLHDGVVPETASESVEATVDRELDLASVPGPTSSGPSQLTLEVRSDPHLGTGAEANNGWLQELPKPFSKLTWGNAVLISPSLAAELSVENGDVLQLTANNRELKLPAWVLPGQPDLVVTVHRGGGRWQAGRVGNGVGQNVAKLQAVETAWSMPVELKATGEKELMASTQHHFLMDGRELIRSGTLQQYQENPKHPAFVHSDHHGGDASLLPPIEYDGYKWGMVIDLNACNGCNACVVACQAENNIPVVGKEEVARGREMHWIRIDTYYSEAPENPKMHFQPLPCMHCENAPCEIVCPVAATTHSPEGINEMTYNRCVGTRYCANNCPYKVRRFNFLEYTEEIQESPILQMAQNPRVTVRARGVMEKCTYCVQRVNAARIEAEIEDRQIGESDLQSACQASCPSQAIHFGNLNDPDATVTKAHESPLRYGLLEELNTNPRTTYLAEVRNPHPKLNTTSTNG